MKKQTDLFCMRKVKKVYGVECKTCFNDYSIDFCDVSLRRDLAVKIKNRKIREGKKARIIKFLRVN